MLRRRPPHQRLLGALIVLCVASPWLFGGSAWAAFSSQDVNNADSFSSATLQLKIQTPDGLSCYSTGSGSGGTVGANAATCSGDPLPTTQL
ncbi:MAG: hypothetical protein ACRDVW_11920, partial [Acidimicrobiales bacterium]